MKINGFQFPTEPKVSFYAPEDKSYNFELLKKIRQVLQMIKEIKTNNVEKGNELEKELKEIVGEKNTNYYDQLNMGDKIDEMYEKVSKIYNGQPLRSKIMEQIELNTEYFKNNPSSITVAEILKIIKSIDNNIGQLLELNDIVDMSKLFDEFRALCISIYYRKKDGNVQNDSVFQELIGDLNTKLALDTYISELNINDKEYKRIKANSDDLEYLENPEIWKIVSDHLGVPILAESEVVTEDNNNILADNNNTSLAIPNYQRRSLGYSILAAIQQIINRFIGHKSTENVAAIEEKADIAAKPEAIQDQRPFLEQLIDIYKTNGALEFLKNLNNKLGEAVFSEDLYEKYEEKLIMLENRKIPDGVSKFKITNPEDMWAAIFEIVSYEDKANPDRIVFKDKNGKASCIMLKDEPFVQSNGEIRQKVIYTLDKQKLEFELILSTKYEGLELQTVKRNIYWDIYDVHGLHFLCEIDKLFGTHCIDSYIEDLLLQIDKDIDGNYIKDLTRTKYGFLPTYRRAHAVFLTLLNRIPNIEKRRMDLQIARNDYYKDECNQKKKMSYLKVKPENMIHVGTLEPPENNLNGFKSSGRVFRRGENKEYIIQGNAKIAGFSVNEPSIGPSEELKAFLNRDE